MIAALLLALPSAFVQDGTWRYVVPAPGQPMEHPAPMALALSQTPSEDVRIQVETPGFTRYGELRYGDADSRRVALLVDQRESGDAHLYLDIDRDRVLESHEKVERDGARWIATVPVQTTNEEGGTVFLPRRVIIELGETGGILSAGTMGYFEGTVQLNGRSVAARRVDGDVNGFFTDPRDQLWLDLDGNGTYSSLTELWLYAPLCTVAGQRYALRSGRVGAGLEVAKVEGTGQISLELDSVEAGASRLNVMLVGRDGSAVVLRALGAPVEVPVGEYRLGMVTLSVEDPGKAAEWSFIFSDAGGDWDRTWYEVTKDGTTKIDPVGQLQFTNGLTKGLESVAPGDRLSGSPALLTQQSLLINTAYRGFDAPRWSSSGLSARVSLIDDEGNTLDEATSGFA